jgi:hypothetical protein
MRLCPSVQGSNTPLITHRIGVEVCMARQRTFFHKCHRCIYRGQAANWEPAEGPMAMLDVHAAEEPAHAEVTPLELGPPVPAAPSAPAAPSKPSTKPANKAPNKAPKKKPAPKTVDASV